MTAERWQQVVSQIKERFTVIDHGEEDLMSEDMPAGSVEWVEFDGPAGRLRLEHALTPRVLETKTLYAHRGGSVTVKKVYSPTEKVSKVTAFKWNDDQSMWEDFHFEI